MGGGGREEEVWEGGELKGEEGRGGSEKESSTNCH